jgi:hypothetical protein
MYPKRIVYNISHYSNYAMVNKNKYKFKLRGKLTVQMFDSSHGILAWLLLKKHEF